MKTYTSYSNTVSSIISTGYFISGLSDFAANNISPEVGIYYNGKTYLVLQMGANADPYIITYTHTTGIISIPVKIGDKNLPGDLNHGQPNLFIDNVGYLHVMWGAHNSAVRYSKSTNPEDITAWTSMGSPTSGSYPQFVQFSDDTIYLFYRNAAATGWAYRTSTNNGTSWSAETTLCSLFSYAKFKKGIGDTIHYLAWGRPPTTGYDRFDVYYMKYFGGNWTNIYGDALAFPITEYLKVTVLRTNPVYVPSVTFTLDDSDNPYILFSIGTGSPAGTFKYIFIKNNGLNWLVYDVGASTDIWGNYATAIQYISENILDIYIVTGGVGNVRGGNIERWRTVNGGESWLRIGDILADIHHYVDPMIIKNSNPDARMFVAECDNSDGQFTALGYLWGDNGFVG